jgi:hypothetical protein
MITVMLSVFVLNVEFHITEVCYAECHDAECHYAECHLSALKFVATYHSKLTLFPIVYSNR